MPTIILHDEDELRLAASVNAKQAEGYAPTGGVLYSGGLYIQPMATGTTTEVYFILREQKSEVFTARANGQPALGSIQYVDGFFLQAFGAEAGGGTASVAWADVTDKPAFIGAGATASAARSAIGAVAIGTTTGTAMDGSKTLANIGGVVPASGLPAASTTVAGIIQIGTGATQAMAGNTALPTWATISGKPAVVAAGADAAAARTAIGAGTPYTLPVAGAAIGGVKIAAAQADSVAADVAALVTDYNNLLAALRTSGVLSA